MAGPGFGAASPTRGLDLCFLPPALCSAHLAHDTRPASWMRLQAERDKASGGATLVKPANCLGIIFWTQGSTARAARSVPIACNRPEFERESSVEPCRAIATAC